MSMDDIAKKATQTVEEDIHTELTESESSKMLYQSAKNFLESVREALKETKGLQTEVQKTIENPSMVTINTIYKAMRQSTKLTQTIVEAQYDFENKLNEFLGRTIYLIWFDQETRQIFYTDQEAAKDIYKKGTRKEGGRASVTLEADKTNLKSFDELRDSLKGFGDRIKNHQNKYKGLFDEVVNRWEDNNDPGNFWYWIGEGKKTKKGKKIKHSFDYPYRQTFYWWDSINGREHSKKINRGNISQAYVHIMMSDKPDLSSNVNQQSVKGYWLYMQNHSILNNIPGIVEGDVILAGKEAIQFAVKSGDFNTAAVGPYLTAAYLILALLDSDIKVETILKNISQLSRKIKSRADILAQKAISEETKATLLKMIQ